MKIWKNVVHILCVHRHTQMIIYATRKKLPTIFFRFFFFGSECYMAYICWWKRERRNIFRGGGGRETETETDKTTEESRKRQNDDNTNTCIEEAKKRVMLAGMVEWSGLNAGVELVRLVLWWWCNIKIILTQLNPHKCIFCVLFFFHISCFYK